MEELVNQLLQQNGKSKVPYSLFVNDTEITTSLQATVQEMVFIQSIASVLF
jgi:ribosome assembly protein 4